MYLREYGKILLVDVALRDKLAFYRARRMIKSFGKKYRENRDSITEYDVIEFYDSLARYMAYFFLKVKDENVNYLIKLGNLLIDETHDVESDFIFVIPLIHLEVLYIMVEEDYSEVVKKLYDIVNDDEGLFFLVNNTLEILKEKSLEDAVASSSGILILGLDAFLKKDEETALKTIYYYILVSHMLSGYEGENYIFSLISYFSLSLLLEIIGSDIEFSRRVDNLGDRFYANSFIAWIVKMDDIGKEDRALLNRKLGSFIRSIIASNKHNILMRESIAMRWYYYKFSKKRSSPVLNSVLRVLEALVRVVRNDVDREIELAERIYMEKSEATALSDEEKDLLTVAALKLYKMGLRSSYENIINFLQKVGKKGGDESISLLASILRNVAEAENKEE